MSTPFFNQLTTLYTEMDNTWDRIADTYSFQCNGCKDNCCKSLFFHYTQIEKDYLRYGFSNLKKSEQDRIKDLSKLFYEQTFEKNAQKNDIVSQKIFCPLNLDDMCQLYKYRPMICRLHGLPHEFEKPGVEPQISPGCREGKFDEKDYVQFDRTLFYQKMAQIEISYRQYLNNYSKIRKTVAQILLD